MGLKWTLITAIILCSALLQSCYKERFEPIDNSIGVTPILAVPIVTGELNIDGSLVLYGLPEINLDVAVPSWAQFETIYFIDTLALSLNDINNRVEEIRFIELNVMTWNEFPAGAQVQIHFINSSGTELYSLFSPIPLTLNAGEVNSSGDIVSKGYSLTTIKVSQDDISSVVSAENVVLQFSVSNLGIPINLFNYYENYNLKIKLSARIGLNLTF